MRNPFLMATDAIAAAREFVAARGGIIIAAWGAPKGSAAMRRDIAATADTVQHYLAGQLHILRLTVSGYPEHPLYLPSHLVPVPWEMKA